MAAAAIAMGVLVAGVVSTLESDHGSGAISRVGIGVLLGVLTYTGLSLALRVDEIAALSRTVRRRVGRG
jgi:hypothetical protein